MSRSAGGTGSPATLAPSPEDCSSTPSVVSNGSRSRKDSGAVVSSQTRRPSQLFVQIRTHLAHSDALFPIKSLFETGWMAVRIEIDEPVAQTTQPIEEMSEAQGDVASIASVCAQMCFLIDKEDLLEQENRKDLVPHLVKEHLDRLYEQLIQECNNYLPGVPLEEVFHVTGLEHLFPTVMERLQLEVRPCEEKIVSFHEYLGHMVQLNQAFAMAHQLREDCGHDNHKYIAHQIALLYQCLSYQNLRTQQFKKRIEPEFEDIKRTTEQAAIPQLSAKQQGWLRSVTSDVIDVCADFNGPVTSFLHMWVDVLAHHPPLPAQQNQYQ